VFTVGGALILAALVLSAAIYRAELDYRFELMSLSITWLVLIVSGTMLTVVFGRAVKGATRVRPRLDGSRALQNCQQRCEDVSRPFRSQPMTSIRLACSGSN